MEALPTEHTPIQRAPIRLQIFESPIRPAQPGEVKILLGGQPCRDCAGLGILPFDPEVDGSETETCGRCLASGEDPDVPAPIDILPSLERMAIEISGEGAYATLILKTDIGPVDFHMDAVARVTDSANPLEGLTAKELEQLVVSCPGSKNMGDHLLEALRARARPES